MTLIQFLRLVFRKFWLLAGFPLLLGVLVYLLTADGKRNYKSQTVIYTAVNASEAATLGEAMKIDFYTANNQFDNLIFLVKSRNTAQSAGLQLLAEHLSLPKADSLYILPEHYDELKEQLGEKEWKELHVPNDVAATMAKITASLAKNQGSALFYVANNHRHYASEKIQEKLLVRRRESSDMLEITFETDDPGVAQRTLMHINTAFDLRHREIKGAQNSSAIEYFEGQLAIAEKKLRDAENNLRDFMSQKRILNYYEQGKYLDITRLELEADVRKAEQKIQGARESREQLESMLSMGEKRSLLVDSLVALRQKLVTLETETAALEKSGNTTQLLLKQNNIRQTQEQIGKLSEKIFSLENTKEGLPRRLIMESYLNNLLLEEESKQAKEIVTSRKGTIEKEMDDFAPLGAELKSLEREVSINEDIYLTILHNLHQARLKREKLIKDNEGGGNVIDPPFFPIKPEKSKRLFLILGALMGSFIFILVALIAKQLLNRNIRNIQRAEKAAARPVSGVLPLMPKKKAPIDFAKVQLTGVEHLLGHLKLQEHVQGDKQKLWVIFSSQAGEGKTHVGRLLAETLGRINGQVLLLSPHDTAADWTADNVRWQSYTPNEHFLNLPDFSSLLPADAAQFSYVMLELPALLEHAIPVKAIASADLHLMVLNARRPWAEADHRLLQVYDQAAGEPAQVVLNRMEADDLEDTLGEIPKKRSKIRSFFKRVLTFQFGK